MKKEEVTGIIMAGGKSSRMGKNKGLCLFNGRELVSYAIETLKPVCGRLIISANTDMEAYGAYDLEVIPDEIKGIGPMGGILSCLKKSETQHNLVLSCDTPFVNTELFDLLLQHIEKRQVLVPIHQDAHLEPLAAYYATNVIATLSQCIEIGDYKMMNFLKKVNFGTLKVDDYLSSSINIFHNLNTPDDLINCG